ncbi:hypothetical protein SK128_002995 [Halocaridina rubra]|uniref:Uncharacterized protein n=1 Tax=Halocaridina rubra TaxID=373956 RepID=A0AAN8XDY4_HALRR
MSKPEEKHRGYVKKTLPGNLRKNPMDLRKNSKGSRSNLKLFCNLVRIKLNHLITACIFYKKNTKLSGKHTIINIMYNTNEVLFVYLPE